MVRPASRALTIIMMMVLGGCAHDRAPEPMVEVREVRVPVPVRATPPAELLAPLDPPPPTFVAPSDPRASSALTPEGERALKLLVFDLVSRLDAWRAWAAAPAMQEGKP